MRITTKSVFEWDKDTSQYVEVYTEGYDYEGELSLAHEGDHSTIDPMYISAHYNNYHTDLVPGDVELPVALGGQRTMPSAWDFANKSMEDIMSAMGYTDEEVSDHSEYVPRYDPWEAEYAKERGGIERAGVALETEGIRGEQKLATELYGLSQEGLESGLQSVSGGGEQAMYEVFQQGSTLAAGGLGQRSNLTRRGKSQAMSASEEQSDRLRLQGLEKTLGYESGMQDLNLQMKQKGLDVEMIDADEARGVESSLAEYDRQFWDFLSQLRIDHGVDFMDDVTGDPDA